jgi:tRNA pseudouridine synthase 9
MFDIDMLEDDEKSRVSAVEPIIIGPFRFIKPYYFTFRCRAKRRWFGRPLVDVFSQEFKHWPREVLEQRIRDGDIKVNGAPIVVDYAVQEHDQVEHSVLRLESPVYNVPVVRIGETPNFVAFLKPASVPVHATGGFHHNSLVKQVNGQFHPVHRLDRVTSGIIVMAKTKVAATHFSEMLSVGRIHKTYVARVAGEFPEGDVKCDAPIKEGVRDRTVRECGEGGKESLTEFRRLATNGRESIVDCHPITGRTHQIRVHLAHLGFPIANDQMYGGAKAELTQDEQAAISEAERRKLWPPDTVIDKDEPFLVFQIYLHSIRYQSDEFDFHAPMPEWANLTQRLSL